MKYILATGICAVLLFGTYSCTDPNGTDSFRRSVQDRKVKSDDNEPSGASNPDAQGIVSGDTIIN